MKIRIREGLIVEAKSIVGLYEDEWEENILMVVNAGHDIKVGLDLFYDCLSTVYYNIDYKEIIMENGIFIAKIKTK